MKKEVEHDEDQHLLLGEVGGFEMSEAIACVAFADELLQQKTAKVR